MKMEEIENSKEFIAFSRKLLRVLNKIKKSLQEKDYKTAEILIDELIQDSESDI